MTEQNGIDILCDAAGSDLLLSSFFSLDRAQDGSNPAPVADHHLPSKRVKLSAENTSPLGAANAGSSHVCHVCKRVYERADHLTRHLRSHENARPYQCTRCPKRFNRA